VARRCGSAVLVGKAHEINSRWIASSLDKLVADR
jgi:hypothetical protein